MWVRSGGFGDPEEFLEWVGGKWQRRGFLVGEFAEEGAEFSICEFVAVLWRRAGFLLSFGGVGEGWESLGKGRGICGWWGRRWLLLEGFCWRFVLGLGGGPYPSHLYRVCMI